MMLFYDHLMNVAELQEALSRYVFDSKERDELMSMFEASQHHVVFDVIFSVLPVDHHEGFLVSFRDDPTSPTHLVYLRQFAPDIDARLREALTTSQTKFIDAIHA